MARPPVRELLKPSLHRSVHLETLDEGGRLKRQIVKRFHSSGRLRRVFDRQRARREWQALVRLRASGLPVPEALELRRQGGAWELVTQYVEDAESLRSWLDGAGDARIPAEQLARHLGRLAARLRQAGMEHGDLHTGNVLLDSTGRPWLIDCAHARAGRRVRLPSLEDELVPLAAEVREAVHPFFRMRFLIEFSRALAAAPDSAELDRAERARLGATVEVCARLHRRSILHEARLRWTRRSSAVRPLTPAEGAGFVRRTHRALPQAREAEPPSKFVSLSLDPSRAALALTDSFLSEHGARMLVYGARSFRTLREHWYRSARLFMHAVPCAVPVSLVRGAHSRMSVELPGTARPLTEGRDASPRWRTARALGELLGTLDDRGFELMGDPDPALLWICDPDTGRLALTPGVRLGMGTARRRDPQRMLARVLGDTKPRERAAFVSGWVAACRGGPREKRRWTQELCRG